MLQVTLHRSTVQSVAVYHMGILVIRTCCCVSLDLRMQKSFDSLRTLLVRTEELIP